jgi:putative transposase
VTHETIRDWEERFAPLMVEQLRAKRKGQAGRSCYVDETDRKVHGRWCDLSHAIERDGNLVASMLSQTRDRDGAKRCFQRASAVVGHRPDRVTTDGHDSYPRAIREMLGDEVTHRCNRYLNNRLEQDHRGIKQRYYPMRGFGSVASAAHFCTAFDEQRQYFRCRTTMRKTVPLGEQRRLFHQRWDALLSSLMAA